MTKSAARTGIAVGIALGMIATNQQPAEACGGFFCSQIPIDQSGEQIIFSLTPNHVTAYIQISYAGAAQDFAWVIPVAAKPEITLGSQRVFQAVGGVTQPQFRVDWVADGGYCAYQVFPPTAAGTVSGSTTGGVRVVDSQDVGPFMTVTLESHDSAQLVQWLNDNGFAQPVGVLPLIDHYVQLNMLFVALRLKQDAAAGEIQPIVLDMATADPCVPLILTRIAAQPDMPVQVYVLGSARAFPANWFHVIPDLAKINWLQFGSNYRQVVTDAINQAAGHGFVTEFAGSSALLKDVIWRPAQYDTAQLSAITDPVVLLQALLSAGYPRDGTMQALLRKWIPMPDAVAARGVTEQMFYNSIATYKADLDAVGFVLNTSGFIADLDERVLMPLRRAQALVDGQPYLTRLFSTISPNEMTRDPIFLLNGDLPDVSNVHIAKAFGMCLPDGTVSNLNLQLEDGQSIVLNGVSRFYNNQPWTYGAGLSPAKHIELVGPSGLPVAVQTADVAGLDTALDSLSPQMVRNMAAAHVVTTPTDDGTGCGCALSPRGHAAGRAVAAVAGAAGLLLVWRRRRRSHRSRN